MTQRTLYSRAVAPFLEGNARCTAGWFFPQEKDLSAWGVSAWVEGGGKLGNHSPTMFVLTLSKHEEEEESVGGNNEDLLVEKGKGRKGWMRA